jgi:hypothetical protein
MPAFVDSYTFSHRFSDDCNAPTDCADFQEINHQCSGVNAPGLVRQFYQFALGCGYAPQNIVDAFEALADEYGRHIATMIRKRTVNSVKPSQV